MLGPLARADDSANTPIKLGKSGLLSMRAGDTVELLLDTTGEHRPRLGTQGTVAFNVNMLTSYDVERWCALSSTTPYARIPGMQRRMQLHPHDGRAAHAGALDLDCAAHDPVCLPRRTLRIAGAQHGPCRGRARRQQHRHAFQGEANRD